MIRSDELIALTPVAAFAIPAIVEGLKAMRLPTKAAGGAAILLGIAFAIAATGGTVDAAVIMYGVGFGATGMGVYSQVKYFAPKPGNAIDQPTNKTAYFTPPASRSNTNERRENDDDDRPEMSATTTTTDKPDDGDLDTIHRYDVWLEQAKRRRNNDDKIEGFSLN